MEDFDDNELEALEQRMRAKLNPEAPRKGGLSGEDLDIARKLVTGPPKSNAYGLGEQDYMIARRLLGSANAERLGRAQEGRRVRIAPVVTIIEWYVVPGRGLPDVWHFDRVVNGRKEDHASGVDFNELRDRLADYRKRNIVVRRIYLEGESREGDAPKVGQRKSFAERFGKVGGNGR